MRVVFDRFWEHGLKLKPSKCKVFKTEINYLAHHVSKRGVLPSKKNLEAIARCPPPDTYTKVKTLVGLVGHYRHFIKGFTNIAAPLYNLSSGENKDKKSEHLDLPQEACEAFDRLKAACLQAPILAFPDFGKPFREGPGSCAVAEAVWWMIPSYCLCQSHYDWDRTEVSL